MTDESETGDGEPPRQETSTAEQALMILSVTFALLLFAYAGWQMATAPSATAPEASVVGVEPLSNDSVAVTVRLRNPSDVGLITATAASNCSAPPPQVQFSYVPASTTRTGTLVCPAGTTDPSVSLTNWISR